MNLRYFQRQSRASFGILGGALLLVFLAFRLIWLATGTETGFQTLRSHWRDATIGWILGKREPLSSIHPADQADYWLREVDRILQKHPNNARLLMGAAVVLDTPAEGSARRYLTLPLGSPLLGRFPEWEHERAMRAEDIFEDRCKNRCLELAAKAAKMEPQNVEWWRLYALLLRRSPTNSNCAARDPNWADTLDECARHDPDNALYDYLAADAYWELAATIELPNGQMQLSVHDADTFNRGIERFERGQTKQCFWIGPAGLAAAADFLSYTRAPLSDRQETQASRCIYSRRNSLLPNICRWQVLRADDQASKGKIGRALALRRQNVRLIAQFERGGTPAEYDAMAMVCKAGTAWQLQQFADTHKTKIGKSERQQIIAFRKAVTLEQAIAKAAARDMAKGMRQPTSATQIALFGGLELSTVLVIDVAASLFALVLPVGLLSIFASRRLAKNADPVVGPVGQVATLVVALSTTLIVFGLAPVEIIGRATQAWLFATTLFLAPLVVGAAFARFWFHNRRFQFSVRAMLVVTFLASVYLLMLSIVWHDSQFFEKLTMMPRGLNGVDPSVLAYTISAKDKPWLWIQLQWTAHRGPVLTLGFWAGLLTALYFCRKWMANAPTDSFPSGRRSLFGGLCLVLGRSALAMSAMLLFVYLLMAPSVVNQVEWEFQEVMTYTRQSQSQWPEMARAVRRVRSDAALMRQLKQMSKSDVGEPLPPW